MKLGVKELPPEQEEPAPEEAREEKVPQGPDRPAEPQMPMRPFRGPSVLHDVSATLGEVATIAREKQIHTRSMVSFVTIFVIEGVALGLHHTANRRLQGE